MPANVHRHASVVTALLAASLPAVARAQSQPASTTAPSPAPITAIATVEAFWSADQYPRVGGYVGEVKADIGDRVTKGQVLAVIDAPELLRDVSAAQAALAARRQAAVAADAAVRQADAGVGVARKQLAGVRADADLADVTLRRQQQLFETKAATEQQIDDARAKAAVARAASDVAAARIAAAEADLAAAKAAVAVAAAQVDVAAAELDKAQTLASFARVTAPFDGVVTRRTVAPGDLVQAAATAGRPPMFTCQQTNTVRVFCDLPESATAVVAAGTPAEVVLPGRPGATFRGTVTRVAASLDPGTRTMRVEIDLPNDAGALRPGTYAQVNLTPAATRPPTAAPAGH